MILGIPIATFTLLHVGISLVAIIAGLVVLGLMAANRMAARVTALFLAASILDDLTGYLFPIRGVTPAIVLGAISLVALGVACWALYIGRLAGPWRATWVVSAAAAVWFNLFVLVVQAFAKLPALGTLPAGFAIGQALMLLLAGVLGWLGLRRFHPTVRAGAA
ncbi:MAG TPA: hypothetical protein VFE13_21230 [Caulobacteraceae bacterium]|jgi:hypothetical protein|nr:hypothetical protein [Caulobacteraceae bacterium]